MNRKNILIIISILSFIIIIGGISYSYFVYNRNVGDVSLTAGEISIDLSGISGNQTLTGVIPQTDNDGKNSSDYFDFTVNATVDTEKIYYEVYILPDSGNALDTDYLKTYLTDQNNVEIKDVTIFDSLRDSEVEDGKVIYRGLIEINNNGTTRNESKNFRLRLWLDEDYPDLTSKVFDFDIYLYAKNVDANFMLGGVGLVKSAIATKEASGGACANITHEEDGITYLSGTNDCVDMNYVWYSGKLWRITAIYPDGAMKLITENNITSIAFNESSVIFYTDANTTSYMYQWLNEDFYDTLYNANQFIDTTKRWNATNSNASSNDEISTRLSETTLVTANVGLLNSYEYYNSYRCIGSDTCIGSSYGTGYLNIGYYWCLLNPYSASNVWNVYTNGKGRNDSAASDNGVRPSINLKSGVEFTGSGTKNNPYKIVGDKDTGNTNELINTRLSGEYVKLVNNSNEQIFRIIGVEDNKTKIIAMDYADNKATRKFATSRGSSSTLWGSGTTTGEGTWYTYLNSTYYPNLVSTYGSLFDSSTYYLGTSGYNYKLSVCANTTSGNTKVCDKTTEIGTFDIGLPRYGEMFATQQAGSYSNSIYIWLMNRRSVSSSPPYFESYVLVLYDNGNVSAYSPTSAYGARPTLHLKSSVKIISGTGTETDPYVVGL